MSAPSEAASKFPQLQWQLPAAAPSYSPEALQQSSYGKGGESGSGATTSTSGKISWQAPAPTRALQQGRQRADASPSRQDGARPQTSGAVLVSTRPGAARNPQRSAVSKDQAGKAASSTKLDWAIPEASAPTRSSKLAQKTTLSAAHKSGSASAFGSPASAPATPVGKDGMRRSSSSGSPAASPPESAKWSRLQALKQQRSSHVRAVLEAGRPSHSPSAESSAASLGPSTPSSLASPAPSPGKRLSSGSGPRRAQAAPRQPQPQQRASQDLSELPALSSAAARLQTERLAAAAEAAPREDGQPLITCEGCSRSFVPTAYERHAKICAKVFQTKRKAYNMAAARAPEAASDGTFGDVPAPPQKRGSKGSGVNAAGRYPSSAGVASRPAGKSVPKWKAQSAQLRAAMAAGKTGSIAAASGPFAAAPEPDMSLVPCPHCGRRFNDKAAERHIPRCQEIVAKPTRLKAGAGRGAHVRA